MHRTRRTPDSFRIKRREFLRLGAIAGASALLAACAEIPGAPSARTTPATTAAKSSGASRPVTLPTYQAPPQMPKPDYPGSADGVVEPGYVNWPKTNFQAVKQAPGDGSQVSIFLNIPGSPPPPLD